jgi:hypothetical protein
LSAIEANSAQLNPALDSRTAPGSQIAPAGAGRSQVQILSPDWKYLLSLWIGLGVESYPYGLLTMIVSLEAIFLSTFVMISQNRADEKQQLLADQEWKTVQEEDRQNEELLALSRQILGLTEELHTLAADRGDRES